jgi:hypothetical protein
MKDKEGLSMDTKYGRRKGEKWRCGILVVEAAVIVPMAVMVTALLLIMIFYVHNRCWYRCAAYECAIVGNGGQNLSESEGRMQAEAQAEARIRDQVMPGTEPQKVVYSDASGTSVHFSGQTYPLFNREFASFAAEAGVERVNPEKVLRMRWAALAVKSELDE